MEIKTLTELIESQQRQIFSLSVHMDCLIEELEESGVLDSKRLDTKIKRKLKKLKSAINKIKSEETPPIMLNFGGIIGEA